jgi:hypothetical protein
MTWEELMPETKPKSKSLRRDRFRIALTRVAVVLVWLAVLVMHHAMVRLPLWSWVAMGAALGYVWWRWRRPGWLLAAGGITLAGMFLWLLTFTPRNDRAWRPEVERLPEITVTGDHVAIHNLRNFRWKNAETAEAIWENRELDLQRLQELELFIVPFDIAPRHLGHIMLGFGFDDGNRIMVSVEARREIGEAYGLLPGMLRQFELIYLFCDEQDPLTLRAVHQNSTIYRYPVKGNPEFIRTLFLDLAGTANRLRSQPQFYDSRARNCTTTLYHHVNHTLTKPIAWSSEIIFPVQADQLLYRLGYLKTTLPYEAARTAGRCDILIRQNAGNPNFSTAIRPATMTTPPSL